VQPLQFKKLSKLRTYTFGAEIKYAQFALFGCYSNYMKSVTTDADPIDRKKTDLYNIGTKYSFDDFTISLSHFASNHRKTSSMLLL
jgi:predicted porin